MHALLLVTLLLFSLTEGCAEQDLLQPKITRVLQQYRVQPATTLHAEASEPALHPSKPSGDTSTAEPIQRVTEAEDIFQQRVPG